MRVAEAGLATIEYPERLTPKEIRAMADQLGDIARASDQANRRDLAELYDAPRLAIDYDHRTRVAEVSITPAPRVDSVGVRGDTHINHTADAQRMSRETGRFEPEAADF
ncbi:hypothetical protein OG558_23895 [Kribbella sp. NBC_01510]|uniref:hypothetical protein n=1 Tax=Kribbella sp. NBC_01510 TaxID=2903581 RepID=UPI00386B69D3